MVSFCDKGARQVSDLLPLALCARFGPSITLSVAARRATSRFHGTGVGLHGTGVGLGIRICCSYLFSSYLFNRVRWTAAPSSSMALLGSLRLDYSPIQARRWHLLEKAL